MYYTHVFKCIYMYSVVKIADKNCQDLFFLTSFKIVYIYTTDTSNKKFVRTCQIMSKQCSVTRCYFEFCIPYRVQF